MVSPFAKATEGQGATQRTVSSAAEHFVYTEGVAGSNPAPSTLNKVLAGFDLPANGLAVGMAGGPARHSPPAGETKEGSLSAHILYPY